MVDIDAAIGFVVARGDAADRARLSWLRTGTPPADEFFGNVEGGQRADGGWPAQEDIAAGSIDATCFRLAEIDDLNGLGRPVAARALDWLARRQRLDGSWEEDPALHAAAPAWARPGDPEARFYLTTNAAFWLAVASADAEPTQTGEKRYETALNRSAQAIRDALDENGGWPGFLISGWLAAAVLHRTEWFYESARIMVVLGERVRTMDAADVAGMLAALLRAGVSTDDAVLTRARARLGETQRSDGAWPSGAAPAFDVHTTLTALRGLR